MARRDVALIIHEGVQALDVAGPLDVFATANMFVPEDEGYNCLLLAEGKYPVCSSNGMLLTAHLSFGEACRVFHTVLVAGGPGLPHAVADEAMSEWL
jgi:transcriptional regulator GlxA family with amidase domain